MRHAAPALLAAALAAALSAPSADAAAAIRYSDMVNAAGPCQGALPMFAGSLRARPLAIANEGGTDAFVTCAVAGGDGAGRATTTLTTVFINQNPTGEIVVNCTIVSGWDEEADYFTRSLTIAAGERLMEDWRAEDFDIGDRDHFGLVSVSCKLPSGTAFTRLIQEYYWPQG